MAKSRIHPYTSGTDALGAHIRADIDNILDDAINVISPLTAALSAGGNDINNVDEIEFDNAAADPTAGTTPVVRNNAGTLKVRVQDTRTNTTARPFGVIADTTGSAAASIGVGILFEAESADEAPSSFAALDAVATDVTAASEDTDLVVMLRAAGAALAQKFRVKSTGALALTDSAADPAAAELARNGTILKWRAEDARTNTVARPFGIVATTSDTPAASIGVGQLFQAESGDEVPSDFGALDFTASDVTAGSEDTYASVSLRVAGRALDEKYRFASTAGDGFTAILTHAVTADRTYTLPDANTTLAGLEAGTNTDILGSRAVDTVYQNTSGRMRRVFVTAESDAAGEVANLQVGDANPPTISVGRFRNGTATTLQGQLVAFVPNDHYYRVLQTGTITLTTWTEVDE